MNNVINDVFYIGVNDHQIDLFEGQYIVPNGMAYNSYVIMDEKIAIMDTVDANFKDEWLNNIKEVLGDKKPTYLVVSHMEPDHSANIINLINEYPDVIVVGNMKTFMMMKGFFGQEVQNKLMVKDGDVLELGKNTLKFVFTPMVHWPEVMMSYNEQNKILFSADAFGKFGALDVEEDWACEARRYYFGIVGKYGVNAQMALKKLNGVDIQIICSLHGPILKENLSYYLGLYQTWTTYGVEKEGVAIAYCSVYGNTKKACELLKEKLEAKGCPKVAIMDLARDDMAECVEDAFKYGKLVLASITYDGGIFPFMNTFIHALTERNYQNRTIGFIENGTWGPMAGKVMKEKFANSKNINLLEPTVKIMSSLTQESISQIDTLVDELLK